MKFYYFISGLPRSGSTLLSTILKQNPVFYADISSPVEALIGTAIDIITGSENNNIISENHRKNIMYGIFDGYYRHINNSIIFDTSRNWISKISLLQKLFPYTKILCPVRDVVSILNSFENLLNKNCLYTKRINDTIFSPNIFLRVDEIFEMEIKNKYFFIKEGYALNPEIIHFIEYKNLCEDPEKTMRGVYEFLEKPYYSHDFKNLKYSNENFDKACNLKNLHTIKKKVEYNPPRCILPPEIVKKYKNMNMEFWRKSHKLDLNFIEKLDNKFIKYQ